MSKQHDIRQVTHGNDWAAFAAFEIVDNQIVFDEPTILTGLVNTSFEETQEANDIYADNVVHMSLMGNPIYIPHSSYKTLLPFPTFDQLLIRSKRNFLKI